MDAGDGSLNDAIAAGKAALKSSRGAAQGKVLIDRDALRTLVANTEVVLRALKGMCERGPDWSGRIVP